MSNIFTNMKNQNANYCNPLYLTVSSWLLTSSQLLSLLYKQIVQDNSDLNKVFVFFFFKRKRKKKCIAHPVLKSWRALEQNIIFLA